MQETKQFVTSAEAAGVSPGVAQGRSGQNAGWYVAARARHSSRVAGQCSQDALSDRQQLLTTLRDMLAERRELVSGNAASDGSHIESVDALGHPEMSLLPLE